MRKNNLFRQRSRDILLQLGKNEICDLSHSFFIRMQIVHRPIARRAAVNIDQFAPHFMSAFTDRATVLGK